MKFHCKKRDLVTGTFEKKMNLIHIKRNHLEFFFILLQLENSIYS